jgi:single-stranded DNA-specific DHH superfamily exonuclease
MARQEGLEVRARFKKMSDYAAAAYYVLSALRRGNRSQLEEAQFRNIPRQLSSAIRLPSHIVQQFSAKLEALLELAALGALCEAVNFKYLRGIKGLT